MKQIGRIKRTGYWYVHIPDHPYSGKQGYVAEHRLVVEKKLGRYLTRSEVVHHINENRTDNRIANLILCESPGKHISLHHPELLKKMSKHCIGRQPRNYNRGIKVWSVCKLKFETTLGSSGKKYCSPLCYHETLKGVTPKNVDSLEKGRGWNRGLAYSTTHPNGRTNRATTPGLK